MNILRGMGILLACCLSLNGMEFNNAALEKTIGIVWTDFVNALVQEVKERGIGKAQTPQDFFVPVLQATIAKTDVRPALRVVSSVDEKELKKTLERVLINVMTEVCDVHPENDCLQILYQLVAMTTKLDGLYERYYKSESTRQAVFDAVNEINKMIIAFETSSATQKERIETFRIALNGLRDKLYAPDISGVKGDISELYESLSGLGDLLYEPESSEKFSILQACVASVRYALDLIQQRYGVAATQTEIKGSYMRFMKTGATIENYKKAYKLLFSRPIELDWCTCPRASFEIRIALIIHVGQDAKRRFAGYKGRLVYTSIGSGSHLQDYLIIQELRAQGFNFLDVNLMELDTRDIKEIHAMIEHPQTDTQKIHAENLLNTVLHQASYTAALVKKLNAFMWHSGTIKDRPKAKDRGTYITLYQNAHDYVDFALKYPQFKTHILVLVDPSGALIETKNIRQANAILMTPRYESKKHNEEEEQEIDDVLTYEQFKNSLLLLLPRSSGVEAYTTIKKPYDVLYTAFFEAITNILQQEKVATEYVPQLGTMLTSGRLEKELAHYLTKDSPFKFWFVANAYIAFHDIVINAADAKALLYQADCIDIECHSILTAISNSKKYLAGPILPFELVTTYSPYFERWYPDVKLLTYESSKSV